MQLAAKVLAAGLGLVPESADRAGRPTGVERAAGRSEYESLLEPGQKPPLNYRNPPGGGRADG